MALELRQLLDQFGDGLVLHTPPHEVALSREISWVAPTELTDPSQFISGRELVLTTGAGLLDGPHDRYELFVESLADAGAAVVGFGTGMSHPFVPPQMLIAATRRALPLVEVPVSTTFTEVSRVVAESVIAEKYELLRQGISIHESLASVLLEGHGLGRMIHELHRTVGGPVAVLDSHGRILANEPESATWPIEELVRRGSRGGTSNDGDLTISAIEISGDFVGFLCVRPDLSSTSLQAIPYATTLIALELARRQAELTGRRELVGQVIDDLLTQRVPDRDASRRLEAFGIKMDEPIAVIAAIFPKPDERIRTLPWGLQDLLGQADLGTVSALVGEELVSVVQAPTDLTATARTTFERLRTIDSSVTVGIGGSHVGPSGLRLSYFEAKEALTHGLGVNECRPLNLSTLLLVNRELPIREMAESLLEPLARNDRERGSELVLTLSAYLSNSAGALETARQLHLHRNSLRYRLQQIETLTGLDLDNFNDRVQLWIALRAVAIEGPDLAAT